MHSIEGGRIFPFDPGLFLVSAIRQSVDRCLDQEMTRLTSVRPRRAKSRRKEVQNGSALEGPMCRPTISLFPSELAATAIIAATETMRPPSRTFR
ncbi:hypothetical protein BC361_26640 [Ensifer sp. LC54]|nr:hypothetical protein BC361_26640 [Ensifer sp. LC54]OCP26825.1 hypothetical protein BC363_15940 [Ensifer sp. LC384]